MELSPRRSETWSRPRGRAPLAIALVAASLAAGAALGQDADDEEVIIIEDEEDEDEIIIIEEDEEEAPSEPRITGALGRLWEAWHVSADSEAGMRIQAVPPEDGIWRLRASVGLETWLLPAPNLSFYANGFGRVFVDGTPETARLLPFADFYEAYAQVNLGVGSVQLGRLVVPWSKTQAAALGDRLNPPDYRRDGDFPDPIAGKQPQYGGIVRTSIGAIGVEGVLFTLYQPTEGSLAAANQGGVRIGRYQGALIRSPARVEGLGNLYDRRPLYASPPNLVDTTTLAARARGRVGDFDLGGSLVWGIDELPSLRLPPEVGRFLAREALVARGLPPSALPVFPCEPDTLLETACFGGEGTLSNERAISLSADVTWGLGVVILKGEVVAYPSLGGLPGKTAYLVDPELGLVSTRLGYYGLALAAEGAIGEWISGSLELFDVVWVDVPGGALLWGVELFEEDIEETRSVHRLAVGASLSGSLLEEKLGWRLRGEAGILQRDVLIGTELRYRLPILNLYVGGEANLFAGFPGSPGWLRQDATLFGIFVGEGA